LDASTWKSSAQPQTMLLLGWGLGD